MKSLQGKVAAITGAGSGIGRALAVALAERGCHVALSDINEENVLETARSIAGVKVTTKKLDVADRAAVYAWADEVVRDHGKCNLIFNNAGVALATTAEGFAYDEAEWIFAINFWGVIYGTKAFLPHLRASGEGHVINISSLFGLLAFPGQSTYNATKFAVRGFTEALRIELEMTGAPVTATCVHPGGIKTNIARAARFNDSVRDLGVKDPERGSADFEKLFKTSPAEAARVILAGVERNARRVLIGRDAKIYDVVQRAMPGAYQWLIARAAKMQLRTVQKR